MALFRGISVSNTQLVQREILNNFDIIYYQRIAAEHCYGTCKHCFCYLQELGSHVVNDLSTRGKQKHLKVLDIGCGCGALCLYILKSNVNVSIVLTCINPFPNDKF